MLVGTQGRTVVRLEINMDEEAIARQTLRVLADSVPSSEMRHLQHLHRALTGPARSMATYGADLLHACMYDVDRVDLCSLDASPLSTTSFLAEFRVRVSGAAMIPVEPALLEGESFARLRFIAETMRCGKKSVMVMLTSSTNAPTLAGEGVRVAGPPCSTSARTVLLEPHAPVTIDDTYTCAKHIRAVSLFEAEDGPSFILFFVAPSTFLSVRELRAGDAAALARTVRLALHVECKPVRIYEEDGT